MCTAPQNVYLPADGIDTDEGHKSVDEVAAGIGAALDKMLGDDARAVELLGGVVNDGVLSRLSEAGSKGRVLVESRAVQHPAYDGAVVRTPTVISLSADDADVYEQECFGPVSYLIETSGTPASIELFRRTVRGHGAMTASVYSTAPDVVAAMRDAALVLRSKGVPMNATWGSLQVSGDRGAPAIPLGGGLGDQAGNANALASKGPVANGSYFRPITYGSSHIQAISFLAGGGLDARTILTYGQSEDPTSPWSEDQTRIFGDGEWVHFPWTTEEITRRTISKYTISSP